jgi:phosphatidylethanolamine/phosphatidyl-N-methylethanolamine N-methyltransferase
MSDILDRRHSGPRAAPGLDAEAVRAAYRRWAGVYDPVFGGIFLTARRRAVSLVNRLPGREMLEVGVGTGLALPHYDRDRRITGIDLSAEMLAQARKRVAGHRLGNVVALHEMDAEDTDFRDGSFDIAVAMFVASVVPHPRRLLAEMRRVVRPGGNLLFVSHFAAEKGPRWWIERALAPASRAIGWHADFRADTLFGADELARVTATSVPPLGIFQLVRLEV